jgi:coproporphyrinogen III oxidase-like Fe-S oxidoreductase
MEYIHNVKSPVGILTVASGGKNISGLWIEKQKYFAKTLRKDVSEQNPPIFENVQIWLDIYFSGKEPDFMPPKTLRFAVKILSPRFVIIYCYFSFPTLTSTEPTDGIRSTFLGTTRFG